MSGSVLAAAGGAVARYQRTTTNNGLEPGFDERLPVSLVRRLVKLRVAELSAVENGRCTEYYADGQQKAVGTMRNGQLHGRWEWSRRDETLMRSGQFSLEKQVGTWTTFVRAGNPTKTARCREQVLR